MILHLWSHPGSATQVLSHWRVFIPWHIPSRPLPQPTGQMHPCLSDTQASQHSCCFWTWNAITWISSEIHDQLHCYSLFTSMTSFPSSKLLYHQFPKSWSVWGGTSNKIMLLTLTVAWPTWSGSDEGTANEYMTRKQPLTLTSPALYSLHASILWLHPISTCPPTTLFNMFPNTSLRSYFKTPWTSHKPIGSLHFHQDLRMRSLRGDTVTSHNTQKQLLISFQPIPDSSNHPCHATQLPRFPEPPCSNSVVINSQPWTLSIVKSHLLFLSNLLPVLFIYVYFTLLCFYFALC